MSNDTDLTTLGRLLARTKTGRRIVDWSEMLPTEPPPRAPSRYGPKNWHYDVHPVEVEGCESCETRERIGRALVVNFWLLVLLTLVVVVSIASMIVAVVR